MKDNEQINKEQTLEQKAAQLGEAYKPELRLEDKTNFGIN